jgi:hypothetical protein
MLEAWAPLTVSVVTLSVFLHHLFLEVLVHLERSFQVLLEKLFVKLVELNRQSQDFMLEVLNQRVGNLVLLSELEKILQITEFLILGLEFLVFSGELLTKVLGEECHGKAWLLLQHVVPKSFGVGITFCELVNRESVEEAEL